MPFGDLCFGCFNITQSSVQIPVGPAPIISTVSSGLISEIRAAQNPVASTSPTNNACSSLTLSGMRLRPWSAYGTRTYSACPPSMRQPSAQPPLGSVQLFTKPFFAEETLAAEGLHIDRHTVACLDGAYLGADLLNNANHLVANGYARHSTQHTAMLDMQVAGADTAERNAHNGIARTLQLGLRFVDQLELAGGYVSVGEHIQSQRYFYS